MAKGFVAELPSPISVVLFYHRMFRQNSSGLFQTTFYIKFTLSTLLLQMVIKSTFLLMPSVLYFIVLRISVLFMRKVQNEILDKHLLFLFKFYRLFFTNQLYKCMISTYWQDLLSARKGAQPEKPCTIIAVTVSIQKLKDLFFCKLCCDFRLDLY